jgi:hypothetical protein
MNQCSGCGSKEHSDCSGTCGWSEDAKKIGGLSIDSNSWWGFMPLRLGAKWKDVSLMGKTIGPDLKSKTKPCQNLIFNP